MKATRLVILCVYMSEYVFGQVSSRVQSTFEVASVKPSAPEVADMLIRPLQGGSLQVTGASLKTLICLAFEVRPFQVMDASQWVDTERFDIDARTTTSDANTPTNPADDRRKILEGLKGLLMDRFQLKVHSETKEQAVYSLVINKGGPKLKASGEPKSLIRKMRPGMIKGQAVALEIFAINLSNEVGRRVIDNTGLAGKYDFELNWDARQRPASEIASNQTAGPAISTDSQGPSLFTALQEQLGLRLESAKGPVAVLVIDHAERPSKN